MRRLAMLIVLLGLGACQMAPGASGKGAPGPNVLTGGEIEVTALDGGPAPAAAGRAAVAPDPAAAPADAVAAAPILPGATPPGAVSAGAVTARPVSPLAATPIATPVPAPAPKPKSPLQRACERSGGTWGAAGKTGASTCIKPTGEGTRQCSRQTDCKGSCLARSGTCAPFTPLFGCNDILQADGRRVTLCID